MNTMSRTMPRPMITTTFSWAGIVGSVLAFSLVLLTILYMYFLTLSVVHVVFRKEVNQNEHLVQSEIAELEATYIEAQHQVSERIANVTQLAETNEKIFVRREVPSLVLSTDPR